MKDAEKTAEELIGGAIYAAIKPLHKAGEKKRRDIRAAANVRLSGGVRTYKKDIVFAVMNRAIGRARGGASVLGARDLYYAVRPLAYPHPEWPGGDLDYNYFSGAMLTEYQERFGKIEGLQRDPRGHFSEPHPRYSPSLRDPHGVLHDTAERLKVPLGTGAVAEYEIPDHLLSSLLYVEKEGEIAKLEAANLHTRFDMGLSAGKGYATEAARVLVEKASRRDLRIYCFHDADPDGYEIARTLSEATRRMPDHEVEIIDLGLTVAEAVEMGLESERFYRNDDLPGALEPKLTDLEREHFEGDFSHTDGDGKAVYECRRYELNAILPVSRRMEYIAEKLREHEAEPKVIPPQDELSELADSLYADKMAEWVDEDLLDVLGLNDIKAELTEEFKDDFELDKAREYVEEGFEEDETLPWHEALTKRLTAIKDDAVKDRLVERLAAKLNERISEAVGREGPST